MSSHHRAFEAHGQQVLRLNRELHRQLLEHLLAKAAHDHVHRILVGNAALQAVEQLVFADLRGARLVLHRRGGVLHFDVREGVGAALAADQQRIALREIARAWASAESSPARGRCSAVSGGNSLSDIVLRVFLPIWIIFVPVSACW